MKDWSGKNLCFECTRTLGANINIGRKSKGRCQRCHSEQVVFKVTAVPATPAENGNTCPECAHAGGVHAPDCQRSELEILKREREEILGVLQLSGDDRPGKSLAEQLELALRRAYQRGREESGR